MDDLTSAKYPTTPPTADEVLRRYLLEGQSPRWWVKEVRPDHHGNEWRCVLLRVFDGVVYVKVGRELDGWDPLAVESGAFYWVPCQAPSPAGVE